MISLPFPFEKQEISQATEELVEFLVFISVFFVALVLILARAMGRMIITPVNKLVAGTREVGLGNLDISVENRPRDGMLLRLRHRPALSMGKRFPSYGCRRWKHGRSRFAASSAGKLIGNLPDTSRSETSFGAPTVTGPWS